jgi:hypothetical protein
MRKLTRSLLLASGVALAGGAVATPALADVGFRFGINVGPPAYYYAPPPAYYYYHTPRYYYYYDY